MKRLVVMLSLALVGAAVAADKPNIVFVLCDDLGYGDVHVLNPQRGKIATPNMDRLASQGMTFTDAHSSSAVCTPSRYSILTGRYNWRSRLQAGVMQGFGAPLIAADRLTVAAMLKQNGYATACIGKWHLGMGLSKDLDAVIRNGPTTRGFDYYFGISASADMPPYAFIENDRFTEKPTAMKELYNGRKGPAAPSFETELILPTLVRKSCEWIEANKAHPFFLYLPLNSPHTPLNPTKEWRGKSGLGTYADFVMETDWAVGEVLAQLDKSGVASNTLVVFTSDNGCAPYVGTSADVDPMRHSPEGVKGLEERGHFPSADRRGYKSDAWDGGHRIPFIVRWPGEIKAGTSCDRMVCQVDFMATCAEILGAKIPDNAAEDSFSLLSLFKGGDKPVRETLVHHSIDGSFAIRDEARKLVLCPGSGGWSKGQTDNPQLYDMSQDVGEKTNLAKDHPEIVQRLTEKLEKLVADGRSTPGPAQANDVKVNIIKRKGP